MNNKYYAMLGDAVRRERNGQLSDVELGKVIMNYVKLLEREFERDARDQQNGKGAE